MRTFDVVVIGAGPGRRGGRGAARGRRARASRSSRTGWSAASARSGRACRRRRCCGRTRRWPRRGASRGAAEAVTGIARRPGGARPPRRDHPRPRRLVAAAVARGPRRSRCSAASACSTGERRVRVGDEELEATPRGHPVHRVDAVDAADRGPRRDRRRVDQPRGDDRQGDPRAARDHGRRRGRRRDGAGVPDARLAGHADRGRAPAAPARGGVRLRAGDRGARGVRRRHPHAARRPTRVEQRGGTVVVTTADGGDGRGRHAARRARPHAADQGARARGSSGSTPTGRCPSTLRMRVDGHPWLYAIGDINGKALFTHMGKYQARIAADHLLGRDTAISHGADGPLSPRVIFTEPQVAAVGHTTDTAARGRARGRGRSRRRRPATPAARSTAATRPARRGC